MKPIQKFQEICVNCCKPAIFRCTKCNFDSYCSQNCQAQDIYEHRSVCFELPELIAISEYAAVNHLDEDQETENDRCVPQDDNKLKQQDTVVGTIDSDESSDVDDLKVVIKDIQYEFFKNRRNFEEVIDNQSIGNSESNMKSLADSELQSNDENNLFLVSDLKFHDWPKSKNIKVKLQAIVQEPNIMSFVEDKKLIDDLYVYMEKEIEKNRPAIMKDHQYLPQTNEIVLGQYNGSWCRACVLDAAWEGIVVVFIDYGNLDLLSIDEILPITTRVAKTKLSFEICSRQYIVDNFPEEQLSVKQQEILESRLMMITNIHVDERGIYHCDIFGF